MYEVLNGSGEAIIPNCEKSPISRYWPILTNYYDRLMYNKVWSPTWVAKTVERIDKASIAKWTPDMFAMMCWFIANNHWTYVTQRYINESVPSHHKTTWNNLLMNDVVVCWYCKLRCSVQIRHWFFVCAIYLWISFCNAACARLVALILH